MSNALLAVGSLVERQADAGSHASFGATPDPTPLLPRSMAPTADAQEIFELLAAEMAEAKPAVLVIVSDVFGAGSRSAGTLMAVLADGRYAGSLSGGCVESAIVAEALDVLRSGQPRRMRLGEGSPYVDVRLPCGGALEVWLMPNPDAGEISTAARRLRERRPTELKLPNGPQASFRYQPRLRVIVAGQGAEALAMLKVVQAYGGDAVLATPQASLMEHAMAAGASTRLLQPSRGLHDIAIDPYTALALLFHDHHWEADLLGSALKSPAFWIGAMGGEKTRRSRNEALTAAGCSSQQIARIHSPIGLIRSARDPATLALSAMAEIVQEYREHCTRAVSACAHA